MQRKNKTEEPTTTIVPWYKKSISLAGVKYEDVVTSAKNISVMLESGLTVPDALDVLVQQLHTGKLKTALEKVHDRVDAGETLADALQVHGRLFGPVLLQAVRVGENTGTLSSTLLHAAEQLEKDLRLKRSIKSAMMYPIIVLSAALALGLGLVTFVLPQMVQVFDSLEGELPATTRALIWIADLFDRYGLILSPTILVSIIFIVWLLHQPFMRPLTHPILLRLPIVGPLSHEVNRARFCRSLGSLLSSGVPIEEGLATTLQVLPNFTYARSVSVLHDRIAGGDAFADLLEEYPKLYPKMVQRMAAVGEESGKLGDSLLYLADYYEQKVEEKAKNLATLIEPVLLLGIGVIVAFIALSILTPIYSITEQVKI